MNDVYLNRVVTLNPSFEMAEKDKGLSPDVSDSSPSHSKQEEDKAKRQAVSLPGDDQKLP